MACGRAQSFVQLALARACVGIGEAANIPSGLSIISDIYPLAKRPMAIALFYAGGMVGILGSFVFGTWLAVNFGWRTAFFSAGFPGIVLALLMIFCAREPEREKPSVVAAAVRENIPSFQLGAIGHCIGMDDCGRIDRVVHQCRLAAMAADVLYPQPPPEHGKNRPVLRARTRRWNGRGHAARWLWIPSLPLALALTFVATALSVIYTPCWCALRERVAPQLAYRFQRHADRWRAVPVRGGRP